MVSRSSHRKNCFSSVDQKSALSRYVHGQESLDGIDVGVAKLLTMRLLDLPYEAKHINYKGTG